MLLSIVVVAVCCCLSASLCFKLSVVVGVVGVVAVAVVAVIGGVPVGGGAGVVTVAVDVAKQNVAVDVAVVAVISGVPVGGGAVVVVVVVVVVVTVVDCCSIRLMATHLEHV